MLAMYEDIESGIFQQDNASAHTCARAMQKLDELGIRTLDWPAHSPDLSPIENIWRALKYRLRNLQNRPKTVAQLRTIIEEQWAELATDVNDWRKFMESMSTRITQVKKSRGYPIKN